MEKKSGRSGQGVSTVLEGASLMELQETLKQLRHLRAMRKQAGKRSILQSGVRVELPPGSDSSMAAPLLEKLSLWNSENISYIENPRLVGGVRIYIDGTLYDGSFVTLTQKIKH